MNWPFNKTFSQIYNDSETGSTGFYPFGCGNLWHSGIHIKATSDIISPIIPGQLIAYRLRQKNSTSSLPEYVTKTYKDTYLSEFSELYTEDEKNKTLYKRNQNRKRYSTDSFMLFKHSFPQLKYDFYTLYTNLNFITDENESLFKEDLIYDGSIQNCSQDNLFFSSIPVGNEYNKKKYFDFIVFSDQNIFEKKLTDKKNQKKIFTDFPKDIKYYTAKIEEIKNFDEYMIPSGSSYKKIDEKNTCAEIELQSFNTFYRIDTDNKTKNKHVIWVSPNIYDNEHIDFRDNASAPLKNEALKYLQKIFADNDFVTKYKKKEDSRSKKTEIKFDEIGAENPKFWIKGDDLKIFSSKVNECGKTTGKPNSIYKVYKEFPYKYAFTESEKNENYEDFEVNNNCEYTDSTTGIIYYKINKKEIYVKKDDVKNCFADAFDWNKWFFDCTKQIGKSKGILCDKNALIKEIECNKELDELFNKAKKYYPLDFYRIFGGYGENDSSKKLVDTIRKQTRKIVCKHPLEFDKSLFPENKDNCKDFSKKYYEITKGTAVISPTTSSCLRTEAENFDIWEGGLDKIFTKGNDFYFLNPAYSLKHFERAGLFEFNPYVGKKYKEIYKGSPNQVFDRSKPNENKKTNKINLPDNWIVVDNPGFTTMPSSQEKRLESGYGKIYGLFNEDYLNVTRKTTETSTGEIKHPYSEWRDYYYHFGIDFCGNPGDPIISLIYGKIISKGWISSNGRCLLIQGKISKHLYMLCHLSGYGENIDIGTEITSGMIVAEVGASGGTAGTYSEIYFEGSEHLHLSVIKKDNIVNNQTEVLTGKVEITIQDTNIKEEHWDWISKTYLDPFNYKYEGGWYKDKNRVCNHTQQ